MRFLSIIPGLLALLLAEVAAAQVAVPRLPPVGDVLDTGRDTLRDTTQETLRTADRLAKDRLRVIDRLVRENSDAIERDLEGEPARRGTLLLLDPDTETLAALQSGGFIPAGRERIAGLDLTIVSMAPPPGLALAEAQTLALRLAPSAEMAPDNLYFASGAATPGPVASGSRAKARIGTHVGIIDGGPAPRLGITNIRGFARGAPLASNHGSAVAGLLLGAGVDRVSVADVYGTDAAGGNALAIAKGLGWLAEEGVRVVSISLVGPANKLLARAVAQARARGMILVAAVGNDGPAAPPAYPASYGSVIAVTGVDRRDRALIEAGRALRLDYSAPGEVTAYDARGKRKRVRGTSFATPLVAARVAAAIEKGQPVFRTLDAEARDLGKKGADELYGRGLVCRDCARR